MSGFREIRYWSPSHRCDCMRLSHIGTDDQERWVILKMDVSPDERLRREKIAEHWLLEAEEAGMPSGDLTIRLGIH